MGKTHKKNVPTDQTLKGFNVIWGQSLIKKIIAQNCLIVVYEFTIFNYEK